MNETRFRACLNFSQSQVVISLNWCIEEKRKGWPPAPLLQLFVCFLSHKRLRVRMEQILVPRLRIEMFPVHSQFRLLKHLESEAAWHWPSRLHGLMFVSSTKCFKSNWATGQLGNWACTSTLQSKWCTKGIMSSPWDCARMPQ